MNLTQTLTLNAIVLKKQSLGNYDEKLTFFTAELGKVNITAFGSRSPHSKRRAKLASYYFLILEISKVRQRLNLLSAKTLQEVPYAQHRHAFPIIIKFLESVAQAIPFKAIDEKIFPLLKYLFTNAVLQHPQSFLNFYLHAAFLKTTGLLAGFLACTLCHKECSETYFFTSDKELIGSSCPASRQIKTYKHAQASINAPQKSNSTSAKVFTKKIQNTPQRILLKHEIITSLSLLAVAYLGYFQKQNKNHVNVHAKIYNDEFIAKNKKEDWLALIQVVKFLCKGNT